MPRTRSLAWSELKLGVLTLVALSIAGITIILVMGGRGFSWQRYWLKTRFGNVAGLKSGSPVRVAGLEVGTVSDVVLSGDQVEVLFQVNQDVRDRITDQSRAVLGSISLLGMASVDITAASGGTPIPEWGYVAAGPTPALLADVTDQAGRGISELTGLISDMRAGRGTVGKLMTDEQLYRELNRFVTSAGDLTEGIKQGRGSLGKLVNDPKMVDTLNAALANIEQMTRQLNAGEGSLGKLLRDEAFSKSLTSATTNLDTLVGTINRGEGTMGKLIADPAVFNQVNSLTLRLDQLIARLNQGEGTAGQLLKDKQLYENINGAVADLRTLIANINKDPRRYLNIRVSIF
jgi:phospholipid/cholesterol/gamma-HCH transport system substrate-binding protein